MKRLFQGFLLQEAEAEESAPAPAAVDEDVPTQSLGDDNSGWAAIRDKAIAQAQADVAAEEDGEDAPEAPAKAETKSKAKAAKPNGAAKPRAANGKFAKAESTAKPAAKATPADEELEEDAPEATEQAESEEDEDLGELELPRPTSRVERLLAKRGKQEAQTEFERERAELRRQIEELRAKADSAGNPYSELQRLAQDGELDAMLQKLGFEKGFATAQQKWLEKRGAVKAEDPRLKQLEAEIRAQREEKEAAATRAEQERKREEFLKAQEEELEAVLADAAESKFREVRGLAGLPDVKAAFGSLVSQSRKNPEFADRPMKFHWTVARNAYRTLYQQLHTVFGPQEQVSQGAESTAPTKERVSPARAAQHAKVPDQSGVATAKPNPLSQSGSAEARGGTRKYKSERDEWEAHTRAVRAS